MKRRAFLAALAGAAIAPKAAPTLLGPQYAPYDVSSEALQLLGVEIPLLPLQRYSMVMDNFDYQTAFNRAISMYVEALALAPRFVVNRISD